MHSFTAVFAASALLATVSGSPLFPRGDVCGVAPTLSSTQNTQPLSQPSGIKTAADCQLQCNARTDCKSFIFGLVDNAIQCKLYSCDAAAIPKQASANLVAYSKACSAVPSVVPTQANPTGKATGAAQQPASNTTPKSTGQTQSNGQTQQSNGQAQQSTGKTQRRQQKQQQQQQSSKAPASAATPAQTCGSKPAGSTNNQPIATPAATSLALCKKQCQANTSCKSFTFGLVNNVPACRLFSVAASAIPAPSTTAQKNAFVAYDVGCSI